VGVYETVLVIVRSAVLARECDVLLPHRFAGCAYPLLPFGRRAGLVVGMQEEVPAQRATSALPMKQAYGVSAQWGCHPAATVCPVLGQARIVRGRRALDHHMPDGLR